MSTADPRREPAAAWLRRVLPVLVVLVLALVALRAWHLNADFPNHSRWSDDHAKFSDEGWYASAALNSALWGRWYLPGDWAPATAMPVWPALLHGVWHFTGVSVVAARALAVVFSWLAVGLVWFFCRRFEGKLVGTCALLLFGASTVEYAFSRLALLEPALVALALLTLVLAALIRDEKAVWLPLLVGVLIPLDVFTKTTAVFLVPAMLYPVVFRFWGNLRRAVRPLVIVFVTAGVIYLAEHFLFAVHYRAAIADFFGHSPGRVGIKATGEKFVRFFYRGVTWTDPLLFPIALVSLMASYWMRELWRSMVWGASAIWCAGYAAFIVYHFDGPPRYFNVLTPAVVMMAVVFSLAVWRRKPKAGMVLGAICAVSLVWNGGLTAKFILKPQYTELVAMQNIKALVLAHPEAQPVLMGNGEAQIELFTGLRAVDDINGYMPEWQKVEVYRPGWVVRWSTEDMDSLQDVASRRKMLEMGEFPAMDDKYRNRLIVYELLPKEQETGK